MKLSRRSKNMSSIGKKLIQNPNAETSQMETNPNNGHWASVGARCCAPIPPGGGGNSQKQQPVVPTKLQGRDKQVAS